MPTRTGQFGLHIMIDGYNAPRQLLSNQVYLWSLLEDLPKLIGMHSIAEPQLVEVGELNPKDPGGLSGFVMIAESHISFHTFPARGFITMDLYTCQSGIDRDWVIDLLKTSFALKDADVFVQERGMRYPVENLAAA
jgi:S-adenosylmethionine decarboxylase